jgi:RNA recognition motif-containing protein
MTRVPKIVGKRVLYVGGLVETVCDRHLQHLFEAYGIISNAQVVRHQPTGKSAGYGFVEMGSAGQALHAVVSLEGTEFGGSCLRVSVTSCTRFPQTDRRIT